MPEATSREVYAQTALYPGSTNNLDQISLANDNVFGDDDGVTQLATVTGNTTDGYAAFLEVGIAVDATTSDRVFADDFES